MTTIFNPAPTKAQLSIGDFRWRVEQVDMTGVNTSDGLLEASSWMNDIGPVVSDVIDAGLHANVPPERRFVAGVCEDHGNNTESGGIGIVAAPAPWGPYAEIGGQPALTQDASPDVNQLEFATFVHNSPRGELSILAHGPTDELASEPIARRQKQYRWGLPYDTLDDPVYRGEVADVRGLGLPGEDTHNGYWWRDLDRGDGRIGFTSLLASGTPSWRIGISTMDGESFRLDGPPEYLGAMNWTGDPGDTLGHGPRFWHGGLRWRVAAYGPAASGGSDTFRGLAIYPMSDNGRHVIGHAQVLLERTASGEFWERGVHWYTMLRFGGELFIYVTARDASSVSRVGLYRLISDTRSRVTTIAHPNGEPAYDRAGKYLPVHTHRELETFRLPFGHLANQVIADGTTDEQTIPGLPEGFTARLRDEDGSSGFNDGQLEIASGKLRLLTDSGSGGAGNFGRSIIKLWRTLATADYDELIAWAYGLKFDSNNSPAAKHGFRLSWRDQADNYTVSLTPNSADGRLDLMYWDGSTDQTIDLPIELTSTDREASLPKDVGLSFCPHAQRVRVFIGDAIAYDAVHADIAAATTLQPELLINVRAKGNAGAITGAKIETLRRETE
ncbi:MAG: hypothetical protein AAGJ46_12105 [Planctomycetota bacterium]